MTEHVIVIFNLIFQCMLLVTLLVAGYIAKFRRQLKIHCLILRVAILLQIVSILAIMLPAMLGYIHRGDRSELFNILMLVHHSLGLLMVAIWIYVNLVVQGITKGFGKLPWAMRLAFFLWLVVLLMGVYLYLVTWVL